MFARCTRVLALVATSMALAMPAHAGSITLRWNAAPGATGYRVYVGSSPGQYDRSITLGKVTQATITDATDCADSFYSVTAFNAAGESGKSNEVFSWPKPKIDSITPGAAMQGQQFTLDIQGNNLKPGVAVSIDNPRVVLSNPSSTCDGFQAAATVEPGAPGLRAAEVGLFQITMNHPDFGSLTGSFEVLVDPLRFDLDNRASVNTDLKLNGWDTILLSHSFTAQEGEALYSVDADIDGDGWVDGDDLAYIASFLGACYSAQSGWQASNCP